MNFNVWNWLPRRITKRQAGRRTCQAHPVGAQVQILESRVLLSSVTITNATVDEPVSGQAMMVFTLTRDGDLSKSVGVSYQTQDGAAKAGADYTATSGIAYFGINNSTTTISVPVLSNPQNAGPLSFTVKLTGLLDNPPSFTGTTNFQVTTGQNRTSSLVVSDLNGDGKQDLVVGEVQNGNFAVLFNTTTAGAATPSFGTAQSFATNAGWPAWVAAADLNGDGKPELVTANYYSTNLGIFVNQTSAGSSTINLLSPFQVPAGGGSPSSLVIADINGDGKLDIVDAMNDGIPGGKVNVLINTTATGATTPTFAAPQTFHNSLSWPRRLLVTDLNGDGKPDITCTALYGESAMVMMNTTAAGSSTVTYASPVYVPTGNLSRGIAAGDFTGDGRVYMAIVSANNQTITVFPDTTPQGGSSFTYGTPIEILAQEQLTSVSIADVNGDGKPDLIAGTQNANHFIVYTNTTPVGATTPTFGNQIQLPYGSGPNSFQVLDLNADGIKDIAYVNANSTSVGVGLGNSMTIGTSIATGTINGGSSSSANPVVGSFDTMVSYVANASAVVLDPNVTVTDVDTTRFNGGVLTISLTANAEAADRLELRQVTRLIGVSGSNVLYRGTVVGTITGGTGTTDLIITLNANATNSAVQAILHNVTYRSVSSTPSTLPRTVQVYLSDGAGGTSNLPTKTISVAVSGAIPQSAVVSTPAGQTAIIGSTTQPIVPVSPLKFDWSGKVSSPQSAGSQREASSTTLVQALSEWTLNVGQRPAESRPGVSAGGTLNTQPHCPLDAIWQSHGWSSSKVHTWIDNRLHSLTQELNLEHVFDDVFSRIDKWL